MTSDELVLKIQKAPKPMKHCTACNNAWVGLTTSYDLWYKAPSDGMAQVLVEEALNKYLKHRELAEVLHR